MANEIEDFCYMDLEMRSEIVFMIPHGYKKPDVKHLMKCPAYHEADRRGRAIKTIILRCPDCKEEGKTCGNKEGDNKPAKPDTKGRKNNETGKRNFT